MSKKVLFLDFTFALGVRVVGFWVSYHLRSMLFLDLAKKRQRAVTSHQITTLKRFIFAWAEI